MKTSGQFQKQSVLPSQPIPLTQNLFQSRPFRDPKATTTAQPAEAIDNTIRMKGYLDSNGRPAWWSTVSFGPQPVAGVQTKLTVGAPNDQYEQEADRVADQVMSMPDAATQQPVQREAMPEEELQTKPLVAAITPLVQREAMPEEEEPVQAKASGNADIQREAMPEDEEVQTKPLASGTLQREEMAPEEEDLQMKPLGTADLQREAMPEEEEALQTKSLGTADLQREALPEEDEPLQTKPSPTPYSPLPTPSLENQLSNTQGSGSPLPNDVRSFMEPRFGADFSQVRVHTGSEAVQMNRDLNAQAFTHKQDVYFGAGKTPGNDALTAHELTHVVQQSNGVQLKQLSTSSTIRLKCSACQEEDPQVQRSSRLATPSNINTISRHFGISAADSTTNNVNVDISRAHNPGSSTKDSPVEFASGCHYEKGERKASSQSGGQVKDFSQNDGEPSDALLFDFQPGKSDIRPNQAAFLKGIISRFGLNTLQPTARITLIEGFTDCVDKETKNQSFRQVRAIQTALFLINNGAHADNIVDPQEGAAEALPGSNDSQQGRAENRSVHLRSEPVNHEEPPKPEAPPKQPEKCLNARSKKWRLFSHASLVQGAIVGGGGFIFTLKDDSNLQEDGHIGCAHHASFIGLGLAAGIKAKGVNKFPKGSKFLELLEKFLTDTPLSIDVPDGGTPFTTGDSVLAEDFVGLGRLKTVGAALGKGEEKAEAGFSIATDPEFINIGGPIFGFGVGEAILIGLWVVK